MQSAQTYLEIVRSRGERRLELKRVYHNLRNRELFLSAYAKLYANHGAMSAGADPQDTVDGMSLRRIDRIIESLAAGTYRWRPARRVYIEKANGKLRPLGLPGWNDKLLQEVIRMVLCAYYEPQFSRSSHGFRPGRSCHTALQQIRHEWRGVKWFIEGDIKGCFDHIDHDQLLAIIGRSIKDERFLKLLREMLAAGYLEDWRYKPTLTGTPQGGVLSPLLANIFLNELDRFVEEELLPEHTKGAERRPNPEYHRLVCLIGPARRARDSQSIKAIRQEMQRIPARDPSDPDFRRLRYVRYADDFLLGFAGPYQEVLEIKRKLGAFLSTLGLTLSEEKTLITNATTGRARFLGYAIGMGRQDSHQNQHRRSINGVPSFEVPPEVAHFWKTRYTRHGKIMHRPELLNYSDYEIIVTYSMEFQGLANYYTMAYDVAKKLHAVKWAYEQSLVKTLARKHKTAAARIYRQYKRRISNGRKVLMVEVPRAGRKPLIASFGAKPVRYDPQAVIKEPPLIPVPRNELTTRLLANECELCGSHENINVHHIRKLSELAKRDAGRLDSPLWVRMMSARRRKTLVVCATCHRKIHAGKYDRAKLT